MSNAYHSQSSEIAIGDGASPEVFNTIAGITDIPELPKVKTFFEKTDITDTHEKHGDAGIHEAQDITLQGNYDPNDTGQNAVQTAHDDGTETNFKVTLKSISPNQEFTFSALVIDWRVSFPAKDRALFHLTLRTQTALTEV